MKEFKGGKFYTSFEVLNIIDIKNIDLFLRNLNQYHRFNGLIGVQLLTQTQAKEKLEESLNLDLRQNKENSLTSFIFQNISETINVNGFLINSSIKVNDYKDTNYYCFESVCFKQSDYVTLKIKDKIINKELLLYPTSSRELVNCVDTFTPIELLSDEEIEEYNENLNEYLEIGQQISGDWLFQQMFSNKYYDSNNLAEKIAESLINEVSNHDKVILTPYYLESEIKEKAKEFGIEYNFNDYNKQLEQHERVDKEISEVANTKSYFRGERNLKLALYAMANLLAEENEDRYKHKSSKKINVAGIAKNISSYLEENKEDFVTPPRLKSGYFATEYSKIKKELSNYIEQALTDIEEEI